MRYWTIYRGFLEESISEQELFEKALASQGMHKNLAASFMACQFKEFDSKYVLEPGLIREIQFSQGTKNYIFLDELYLETYEFVVSIRQSKYDPESRYQVIRNVIEKTTNGAKWSISFYRLEDPPK